APAALSAAMNRAGSTSPGLMLLPHPIADQVHGPMQRGHNKDDGEEAEEREAEEESREGPRGERETEEQSANHEVKLVEPGGLRPAREVHPPLPEGAREVSEECAEGQNCRGAEGLRGRPKGPRRFWCGDVERQREEKAEDRTGQGPTNQATPRLAVPEDPLPTGEPAAEVDRRTSAEDDRHRVREEGGEEEPEGLGDRLEGHRAIERETWGYR